MFTGRSLRWLVLVAGWGCWGGFAPVDSRADDRPNILFIMADDHGYQAMGCYGSQVNETPNLDRIAKEGMRFDRCFVTNSICGPARAVILTGKYSHLNGFIRNGNRFNGDQQHVGKLLQAAGYETAVIGKWHLETDPTGFDYWHILRGQGPYYNPDMLVPGGNVQHTGYTTEIITDEALQWLQGRDDDKPFFLLYWHKAPHRNWQPGPKQLTNYDDVTLPEPVNLFDDYAGRGSAAHNQQMTVAEHLNANDLKLVEQRGLTDEQRVVWDKAYGPKNEAFDRANLKGTDLVRWKYQRYVKDYLRCVDAVDENVGRVLDYLDESGLAENTIVIYSSDQGWYLGEHGWYDKRWMYEESFRTPLLVRWPGKVQPGSVNSDLVMNLDFAETFLDVAGVEIPADMQGRSLRGVLEGRTPADWRKSVYYHYYEFPGAHSVAKHYGVRTDRYKLIFYYDLDEWELFDLVEDPHEMKSVYDDPRYAEVRRVMHDELDKLREQYHDDGTVVNFNAQRARNVKLSQAVSFAKDEAVATNGRSLLHRESNAQLDPSNKPLVIGGWCRLEQPQGVLVAQGGESLGYSLSFGDQGVTLAVRDQGVLHEMSVAGVTPHEWVHVAAQLDADGKGQIFINGKAMGEPQALSLLSARPADGLDIGHDGGSLVGPYSEALPLSGEVRDVRVYWGVLPEKNWAEWTR